MMSTKTSCLARASTVVWMLGAVPSPDDGHEDIVLGEGVDSGLNARIKLTRRGDPVVEGRNGALL